MEIWDRVLKFVTVIVLTISLAFSTVHSPVIVAVIMYISMAVKEEAILAVLEGQGAVRA